MAAMSHQDPARMYSWWWDSHICPKNSKWLQENLTDMDSKVKQMIKLIEEDADSFARRAEMYYKRRPELMKLVEEFYRAYRALAERYDNANGVIRHAHQTMAKAFPDQVPPMLADDSSSGSGAAEAHPQNSENPLTVDAFHDPDSIAWTNGLQKLNDKGLDFHEVEEQKKTKHDSHNLNAGFFPELEHRDTSEADILLLRQALDKLEAENKAHLLQHQHSLERLSNIESEIIRAQDDSRGLNERGSKAEAELKEVKEALSKLEAEKEATLIQYQQCLKRISNLEDNLFIAQEDARQVDEQDSQAEIEVQALKQELDVVLAEQEQYLEKISDLENKILKTEEDAQRINERADKAEGEVENLKQELKEKQTELGRLWTCIQEEQLRFVEAETAFQNLQHLHFQSKEKLRYLYLELETKAEIIRDLEVRILGLQEEVLKVKEENETLNKLNLSSEVSMEYMKNEISGLREKISELQEEDELRVDQRNALHRDIYCLEEELCDLKKKYGNMMEQIESLGMTPECLGSSVKELQDENIKLNDVLQSERSEKVNLLDKLQVIEKYSEENLALEVSVSNMNVELEGVREKVKSLEESCQLLLREMSTLASEKATLISQLHAVTENSSKLRENNGFLENSLNDANVEIQVLRGKLKKLEHSYQYLDNEKFGLTIERGNLSSKLEISQQRLENLQRKYEELEGKTYDLEKVRNGIYQILRALEIDLNYGCEDEVERGKTRVNQILCKVENMKNSLDLAIEENQQLVLEKSVLTTLLGQLKIEAADLETEKNTLCQNIWINTQQLEVLQNEIDKLKNIHEGLGQNLKEGCDGDKSLRNHVERFYAKPKRNAKITSSVMHKGRNEAELWENEAAALFSKLQISAVQGALFIEKAHDFSEEPQRLENTSNSRDAEIQVLKVRVGALECENRGLKSQLSAYIAAITSLRKCVVSLESHSILHEKLLMANKGEAMEAASASHLHIEVCPEEGNDLIGELPDKFSELHDLQHRIESIERALEEMERSADKENVGRSSYVTTQQERGEWRKDAPVPRRSQKLTSEFSQVGTERPKDIMLDQISASSSYRICRRETGDTDDRMLELWEATDKSGSIDLAVGKSTLVEQHKKKPSSKIAVQKNLDVIDKLEISKRVTRPRKECKKRRIQDRLDSDALKLINLQITVQDLRRKMETTMEGKKDKGIEYNTVKEHLKEAEKAIMKLFDTNGKLKKKIDNDGDSSSSEGQYGVRLDKAESFKRRGVSDRARRGSEKIKRLQLEVQRLQFLLLKLDEEKEIDIKTKITEHKTKVVLRDYLYGGVKTMHGYKRKKKAHCCSCVQPPTKGD